MYANLICEAYYLSCMHDQSKRQYIILKVINTACPEGNLNPSLEETCQHMENQIGTLLAV